MLKMISVVILLIIVCLGGVYFAWGPNVFFGGPKTSDIINVTRESMISKSVGDEKIQLAKTVKIIPHGICNKIGNKFACGVTISYPDSSHKDFVSVLEKNASGEWTYRH